MVLKYEDYKAGAKAAKVAHEKTRLQRVNDTQEKIDGVLKRLGRCTFSVEREIAEEIHDAYRVAGWKVRGEHSYAPGDQLLLVITPVEDKRR